MFLFLIYSTSCHSTECLRLDWLSEEPSCLTVAFTLAASAFLTHPFLFAHLAFVPKSFPFLRVTSLTLRAAEPFFRQVPFGQLDHHPPLRIILVLMN